VIQRQSDGLVYVRGGAWEELPEKGVAAPGAERFCWTLAEVMEVKEYMGCLA